MANSKKEIESIRIEPAKNGGHTVRHSYKSTPNYSKSQGMGMEHHPSEEFVFGSSEGKTMLAHVANHLHLKNSPDSKAAYAGPEGEEE